MEIKLFRDLNVYTGKDGKEHKGYNFYLSINGNLVAIKQTYLKNQDGSFNERDYTTLMVGSELLTKKR